MIEINLMGDDEEQARKAALQAFQGFKRTEHLMSPWVESSDVNRINRSAGDHGVKPSPEIHALCQGLDGVDCLMVDKERDITLQTRRCPPEG